MAKNNKDFFKVKKEWSVIKDRLLGCYLAPYFQKIITTGRPVCYVDCFSGKGKFEDGNAGSPLIALKIRDECIKNSKYLGSKEIQLTFVELNHASELESNISTQQSEYKKINIVSGKFEDQIENILSLQSNKNVFLYIDPYGIKALDISLFNRFSKYKFKSFEMLINFNSFGFFRDACRAIGVSVENDVAFHGLDVLVEYEPTKIDVSGKSEDIITQIAGGTYWKEIVNQYKNGFIRGYDAEKKLSLYYKKNLQKQFMYVLDMPIRLKPSSHPKYRMIHVSNHETGCFYMADNMLKRKDELFINIQQKGQCSLFDVTNTVQSTCENTYITIAEIKKYAKDFFKGCTEEVGITKFLAEFMNTYGLLCRFSTLYEILEELEKENYIKISRIPHLTKQNRPRAFWVEDKKQKMFLKANSNA